MMRFLLLSALLTICRLSFAQMQGDFTFGQFPAPEQEMKYYIHDSAAHAVVLQEYGKADLEIFQESSIVFYYHVKIKILSTHGIDQANVSIPLNRYNNDAEKIQGLKASTFNFQNGHFMEFKLDNSTILHEKTSPFKDHFKFTFPDVKEGSIIEYSYKKTCPFIYRFHQWNFQSDIPKIHSEYWTQIPGVYDYNVLLKGYQSLTHTESQPFPKCMRLGDEQKDCMITKYLMKDVPAFYKEDFMMDKKNFLSILKFELKTIHHPDGHKDQVTKQWSDVDEELKNHEMFGAQIRRLRNIFWDENLKKVIPAGNDTLLKAKKIYAFIQNRFTWDGYYSLFSDKGINHAFQNGKGNIADINIALISALKYAGIKTSPVILSTRDNGVLLKIHPAIADFNYIVAHCNIGGKVYFLDASQKDLPFGMLPVWCLNGQGRIIHPKFISEWIDIPPAEKNKTVTILKLKLKESGNLEGTINKSFSGYDAYDKRVEIRKHTKTEDYIEALNKKNHEVQFTQPAFENLDSAEEPLKIRYAMESAQEDEEPKKSIYLNPSFDFKFDENPFKSKERLYPVDFAYPWQLQYNTSIELPAGYKVESIPEKIGLSLPDNGAKFVYAVTVVNNFISISSNITVHKTLFTSEEYHSLKELFHHIVQSQKEDIIIVKK